jgi:hypothetical protein
VLFELPLGGAGEFRTRIFRRRPPFVLPFEVTPNFTTPNFSAAGTGGTGSRRLSPSGGIPARNI